MDSEALLGEEVVLIELSKDEALVLHEFLQQVGTPQRAEAFAHPAEEALAREIAGLIRAEMPETRHAEYAARLQAARQRLHP